MQGIVIAGTHSGCGKTTVTLGILAALGKKGFEVQPFKAGPDFIDAGLHRLITGRPSRNLDIWMSGKEAVARSFKMNAESADIAVVEGVMGLYDGEFSTATLAVVLGLPIILVIDAYGMAESAGAIAGGFISNPHDLTRSGLLQGIIFNRVASDNHFKRLKESVQDVPVLGYLPRSADFEIHHRHLGLFVAEEAPLAADSIDRLADAILNHINIDELLKIASVSSCPRRSRVGVPKKSEDFLGQIPVLPRRDGGVSAPLHSNSGARVAVAYDRAFCFYYEDNLDRLREAGFEIVPFSPLTDTALPDAIDVIYVGGGYPELYAEALSKNLQLIEAVRAWASSGKPVYAECGGLMYLSRGIFCVEQNFFPMGGILPFETTMTKGRVRLGYREVMFEEDCILGRKGDICRGHEFHYSDISDNGRGGGTEVIYSVRNRAGEEMPAEGYRQGNVLASYIHVHFGSNSAIASNFMRFVKERRG